MDCLLELILRHWHQVRDEESEEEETSNIDPDADASIDANIKKLQNIMEEQGVEGVKKALRDNSNKWKNTMLHIAVTGSSGAGKSAFINALRGIEAEEEGGAKAGVTETTADLTPYKHPKNPNFIVWDMPGIGTPNFPKETYLKRVKFDQYDFFMILSSKRFTEEDLWLAKQTQEQKKPFYFIRSKIDEDIHSDSRANQKSHRPENVLSSVRIDCSNNLVQAGIESPKVFLVDNLDRKSFDFGQLEAQLLEDSSALKMEAMAFSLSTLTKEVLQKKTEALEGRIGTKAMEIACADRFIEKIMIFETEISYYKDQFDLNDKTLEDNKVILKLSEENLTEFQTLDLKIFQHIACRMITLSSERKFFTKLLRILKKKYKSWLRKLFPVLQFSFVSLKNNLDEMHKMALHVYDVEAQKGVVCSALTSGENATTKYIENVTI